MNKKLYFLNEEEKNRILNLHEERTKKQYLILEMSKDERADKFYNDYAVHCLQDITIDTADMEMKQINEVSERIYKLISGGGFFTSVSQSQLNQLVAIIKNLKTAGNYCAVDKRTTEIIREKGTGTSWYSTGYNNMHEVINAALYKDSAWNEFVNAVRELKYWEGKPIVPIPNPTAKTTSEDYWINSNLTKNPNPSDDYNCVKYAYKKGSSKNWLNSRSGLGKYIVGNDLNRVDKAYLQDPNNPGQYTNFFYYYGNDLRYFSDGIWQDRTNKKITGEYYCGPGLYLEAVITGSTTTSTTNRSGGGGGGGTITVNCSNMGTTKLSSQQISDLRKSIESTETSSSLSQNEINLIYNKIK